MLHQIGAGVLGPVFRAYQPDPGRLVAVKQFRLDIPPDSAHRFVAALDRLIAADLTHAGIAAPLAAGLEQHFPYLAQDFVAAESFDVVMRDYGPAPVTDVLRVTAQLGGALDFAAAVQVFHGSLHPRDVLVTTDDTRVTGLGIAQALESLGISPPVRRPYTAPERVAGAPWDRRADVFSLAALAYEMLFGRRIAGLGRDAAEAITAVEGSDADALRALFTRALAENPADRFETALAFAEALHAALGPGKPARPRTRRKRDTDPTIARAVASYRATRPALPLEPDLPLITAAEDDVARPLDTEDAGAPPLLRLDDQDGPDAIDVAIASPLDSDHPPAQSGEPHAPGIPDAVLQSAESDRYVLAESASALPESREIEPDVLLEDDVLATPAVAEPSSTADEPAPEVTEPPAPVSLADDRPLRQTADAPAPSFSNAALEQSRSAIWPLLLALVVGLLVGYAFGYGMGTRDKALSTSDVASARGTQQESSAPDAPAPVQPEPQAAPVQPSVTPGASAAPAAPPAVAPAPPAARVDRRPSAPGRVAVRSRPSGARVTIDGRDAGVTPTTLRELAAGSHLIRIAHEGYVTAERRVRIRTAQPAQSIEVNLEATRPARQAAPADAPGAKAGSLMVDSRPAGARVFVDGRMVGTTPMLLDAVAAGDHTVRLELDGFSPWTSPAKVTGGERTRVSGSLEQR